MVRRESWCSRSVGIRRGRCSTLDRSTSEVASRASLADSIGEGWMGVHRCQNDLDEENGPLERLILLLDLYLKTIQRLAEQVGAVVAPTMHERGVARLPDDTRALTVALWTDVGLDVLHLTGGSI